MVTIIKNGETREDRSSETLVIYALLGLVSLSACLFLIPIDIIKVLCVVAIGALIIFFGRNISEVTPQAKLDLDKDVLEVNRRRLRLVDLRIVPKPISFKLTPVSDPISTVTFYMHHKPVAKLILSNLDWLESEIPGFQSYFVDTDYANNKR